MNKKEKLDKIENLLSDERYFNDYIDKLELDNIEIPNDLNNKILSRVRNKKKVIYFDICKIAACLIFALSICQTDFIKNDNISKYTDIQKKENTVVEQKISEVYDKFAKSINLGGKGQ